MTVGIRGLGLIGGSFEKAFRRAGHKVVDLKAASAETIGACNLVIVCLPPLMVAPWILEHAADFAPGTLVTDAAGVKGVVCPAVEEMARQAKWIYVGGHPMAGKERSGYVNSDADLFRGASMIFTPFDFTPAAAVERLKGLFSEVGFVRFVVTDPRHHDEMIAYTSQLAHVVSSAYVRDPLAAKHLGFSAGSYQDMTRVATVDPDIWTDLFLSNADALDAVLSRLIGRLCEYREAIRGRRTEDLRRLLAEGRSAKETDLPKLALDLGNFPKAKTIVLVTDSNVDRLYGDAAVRQLGTTGLRIERIVFPAGEKSKSLETCVELLRGLAALELTRTDFVVALGGGVVGDIAGFAAATYLRGIGFVQVPTTLLAMVDSSIGGKTGADIPEGKNLVGAFHLPKQIIRDVGFLGTLPEREMKNGFAEMIKTAVLFDEEMFKALRGFSVKDAGERKEELWTWIERCAAWKQKIVDADFREGGRRKLLNLGHTFGHAIEVASDFQLEHGECVAIGMRIVGRDVPEIGEILDQYGFPKVEDVFAPPFCLSAAKIRELIAKDKKRSGDSVTLIVPRRIGHCELVETPLTELDSWLR